MDKLLTLHYGVEIHVLNYEHPTIYFGEIVDINSLSFTILTTMIDFPLIKFEFNDVFSIEEHPSMPCNFLIKLK